MNLDIRHFKNELSDYNYLVSKIGQFKQLRLELETKRGLHGVRYDKEASSGSADPLMKQLNRLNDIEKADYINAQIDIYEQRKKKIDDFIDYSALGAQIMRIHCLGTSTYEIEAKALFMGVKTLKRRVNREIFDYLIKEEYGGL